MRGDLVELSAASRTAKAHKFSVRQRQSGLAEIQRTLNEVRGNLVTAADGLSTAAQRRAIQQEINASLDAIDQIASRVDGISDSKPLDRLRDGGDANVVDGNIELAANIVDGKLKSLSFSRAAEAAYENTEETFCKAARGQNRNLYSDT